MNPSVYPPKAPTRRHPPRRRMPVLLLFAAVSTALSAAPVAADSIAPEEAKCPPATSSCVPAVSTYSIVAFDPDTGDLGVAVASKALGVGSIVPWAKAGVGALATQSYANTSYGPKGLPLLAEGHSAADVVAKLTSADEGRALRQLGMVDANGEVGVHTGEDCHEWAGHRTGQHFTIQGNLLADEAVIDDMEQAFLAARNSGEGQLPDWLLAALRAGEDAGGDARGKQSAALLVVRDGAGYGGNDRFVDLRVEDHAEPVSELTRLLEIHKSFFAPSHRHTPQR